MGKNSSYDLALLGWGTRGKWQLTLEQLNVLEHAEHVVVAWDILDESLEMLQRLKVKIHRVEDLYREGVGRRKAYHDIAQRVMQLAKRHGSTVWIQYGHPLVYSTSSMHIVREAEKFGLKLLILPGISSIEQIYCLLKIDIRERDLQIFHAQHLYEKNKVINPFVDLILMQVSCLGMDDFILDPQKRAKKAKIGLYKKLQDHLGKFYPPDHGFKAVYVQYSPTKSKGDIILEGRMGQIAELAPLLSFGCSIYVEALESVKTKSNRKGSRQKPARRLAQSV